MTRRLKVKSSSPLTTARKSMEDFLGPAKPKRAKASAGARRKQYIEEVADRMKRTDWDGVTAGKLVALYWLCHERVYGTVPVELDKATTWETAMKSAGLMVKQHFDDDVQQAIVYMRWVWTREQDIEGWRRKNSKQGRRITWQNQFRHDYLITDWRAAAMRARGG